MPGPFPPRPIREEDARPGFFFHGNELFPARQFIRGLSGTLAAPGEQGAGLERFVLAETGWRDILDIARTMPFFFSPWRLLVAEASAEDEDLSAVDEEGLNGYFASPTPRTVIIVLFAGKLRKTKSLFKLFASLPPTAVMVREMKPLKGDALSAWVNEELAGEGKRATSEAIDRLVETAGNDLERLHQELIKLATYVGERKVIEPADVDRLSAGTRDYESWEFTDSLEKGDIRRCLLIVKKRFEEGDKSELAVLYNLTSFFRDILLAKAGLREGRDKAEIFQELRPRILKSYNTLYRDKFRDLFGLAENLGQDDLARLIARLEETDRRIKTTDAAAQPLLEAVILEFGRLRRAAVIRPSGRS